jgi:hypothetical protein
MKRGFQWLFQPLKALILGHFRDRDFTNYHYTSLSSFLFSYMSKFSHISHSRDDHLLSQDLHLSCKLFSASPSSQISTMCSHNFCGITLLSFAPFNPYVPVLLPLGADT